MIDSSYPMAESLSDEHEIDFFILLYKNNLNSFVFDLNICNPDLGLVQDENLEQLDEIEKLLLRDWIYFYILSDKGLSHNKNYRLLFQLSRIILSRKYDVVHIIGQNPILLYLHMLLYKQKRFHTLHESAPHDNTKDWRSALLLKGLTFMNVNLVFNSKVTMERYFNFIGKVYSKSSLIRFGYYFQYKLFKKQEVIQNTEQLLFVGYVKKYKGIEVLFDAMDILINSGRKFTLVVIGKWSEELIPLKEKYIGKYTIIDQVVSASEMADQIQKSKIIICPYLSASQSGLPMTAFALNRPVIASDIDGFSEIIQNGNNGYLFKANESSELAKTIDIAMCNNENYNNLLIDIAKREIEGELSWKHITAKYTYLYSNNKL